MLKQIGRSRFVQEALGAALAGYLRLVRRTNRFILEPVDVDAHVAGNAPVIVGMWHGQHLMISYAWPKSIPRMAALISRSADGGVQAAALRNLGVAPVRGSGGGGKSRGKGGVPATLQLLRHLKEGTSIAMMADAPKRARIAGPGIIAVAKLSGCPIAPTAVVTSRRFDFRSWDRASVGKPFGRGAIVVGDLIHVPKDVGAADEERLRLQVQDALDEVHRRAYALVGARDPGENLRPT